MTTPEPEPDERHAHRVWWIVGAVAALVAVGLGVLVADLTSTEPVSPWARVEQAPRDSPVDYDYVVPKGAVDRLKAGEDLAIVPADLTVKVGQVLRIRNEDLRPVQLGPFSVGPLQTLTQRFTTPGRLEGECNVHASGRIAITVEQ